MDIIRNEVERFVDKRDIFTNFTISNEDRKTGIIGEIWINGEEKGIYLITINDLLNDVQNYSKFGIIILDYGIEAQEILEEKDPIMKKILEIKAVNENTLIIGEIQIKVEIDHIDNRLEYVTKEIDSEGLKYRAVTINANLLELSKWYGLYREKLFDGNVRYEIRDKNDVNKAIKSTIRNEKDKTLFWLYNNGITIHTDDAIILESEQVLYIKNPSIINGAQTVSTLNNKLMEVITENQKYQEYKDRLSNEYVLLKILVPLISRDVSAADSTDINLKQKIAIALNRQKAITNSNILFGLLLENNYFGLSNLKIFTRISIERKGTFYYIDDFAQDFNTTIYQVPGKSRTNKSKLLKEDNILSGDHFENIRKLDELMNSNEIVMELAQQILDIRSEKDIETILNSSKFEMGDPEWEALLRSLEKLKFSNPIKENIYIISAVYFKEDSLTLKNLDLTNVFSEKLQLINSISKEAFFKEGKIDTFGKVEKKLIDLNSDILINGKRFMQAYVTAIAASTNKKGTFENKDELIERIIKMEEVADFDNSWEESLTDYNEFYAKLKDIKSDLIKRTFNSFDYAEENGIKKDKLIENFIEFFDNDVINTEDINYPLLSEKKRLKFNKEDFESSTKDKQKLEDNLKILSLKEIRELRDSLLISTLMESEEITNLGLSNNFNQKLIEYILMIQGTTKNIFKKKEEEIEFKINFDSNNFKSDDFYDLFLHYKIIK